MYNGPSGPRISLAMTFSSAHAALATNIAPTAKQTILRALILIPFPVSSGWTQHLFGTLADGERAHRLRIGMRRSFHKIVLHVVPELFTKHIAPIFPEGFAPRRAHKVHDDKLPPHPQWRGERSLAPFETRLV